MLYVDFENSDGSDPSESSKSIYSLNSRAMLVYAIINLMPTKPSEKNLLFYDFYFVLLRQLDRAYIASSTTFNFYCSPNIISRYISLTLVSSSKVGEKRIREGLILFELLLLQFLFATFLGT